MTITEAVKHEHPDRQPRPFLLGVIDGVEQGELSSGITWEDCDDCNQAYDHGANVGEALAAGGTIA